jgi:hypothetical protein
VNETATREWYEQLLKRATDLRAANSSEPRAWATVFSEMHVALESVFPSSHAILRRWEDARLHGEKKVRGPNTELPERWVAEEIIGLFEAAHSLIKEGHLRRLADGIRAETIAHCLDQAELLANGAYLASAMVLAGGALETHLANLCSRFSLSWTGDGTIAKYNQALGQARNQGTQNLVTASDSNLIEAWAKDRNAAAHAPATFAKPAEEVLLALQGIRQFFARTE